MRIRAMGWTPAVWTLGILGMAATAGTALADDILIYGTGVNEQGVVLVPGSQDPHYQITQVPAGQTFWPSGTLATPAPAIVSFAHSAWGVKNDPPGSPGASWIGFARSAGTNVAPGNYVYSTTFDLGDLDPNSAWLAGNFATDNTLAAVLLNGVETGVSGGNHAAKWDFVIGTGFVGGVNTLEFVVTNVPPGFNPSGLRVEIAGQADPAPQEIEVGLDVRPGSAEVVVHVGARGFVPALVRGSAGVDVAEIDVATLKLGGAPVAVRRNGSPLARSLDLDGDGIRDLVFVVRASDLELVVGDTEILLKGQMLNGMDLVGRDSISVREPDRTAWWRNRRDDRGWHFGTSRWSHHHTRGKVFGREGGCGK